MINQQLLDYIKKQQEAGTADDVIKDNLLQAGWRQQDVDEGFQAVSGDLADDNSTAAHQEMRQAAAKKRGGNDDVYREPIKGEDAQQAQSGQSGSKELETAQVSSSHSDVGTDQEPETAADNTAADGGLSPIDESASAAEKKDSHPSGMEKITSEPAEGTSKSTTESMKKLAKQDTSQVDQDEIEPQAVRTFHSDSERAGVSGGGRSRKMVSPTSSTQEQEGADTDKSELKSAVGEVAKEQAKKDKAEADERKAREKAAAAKAKERRVEADKTARAKEKEQVHVETDTRQTDDGRRRFSAGAASDTAGDQEVGKQIKRRAARKKRRGTSADGSSGSNAMSIVVFILALLLVGGGAAWVYFTYFQSETPDASAASVVSALQSSETFNFRTTIESADISGASESQLIIEGAVDLNSNTPTASYYTISQDGQLATPVQAVMAETENIGTVPQPQMETINDILYTPEFFSVGEFQTQERLGQTENNEGFVTNRFSVSMNPSQFVSDYATLHQALFDTPLSGAVLESLQASVGGFQPTQGQTWIDPETGVPYQVTFIGTNAAGQDVQVNLQFKNHGQPLDSTPPYEPRSFEQTLGQYFATVATSESESSATTATSSEDVATSSMSEVEMARRYDRLRINDIQQLRVALRIYANDNEAFPDTLAALRDGTDAVLTSIPRDPVTDIAYVYSVANNNERFHLGATLEVLGRSDLFDDANFNSRGQGFPRGFNGAVDTCGETATSTSASTCYDVAGSLE